MNQSEFRCKRTNIIISDQFLSRLRQHGCQNSDSYYNSTQKMVAQAQSKVCLVESVTLELSASSLEVFCNIFPIVIWNRWLIFDLTENVLGVGNRFSSFPLHIFISWFLGVCDSGWLSRFPRDIFATDKPPHDSKRIRWHIQYWSQSSLILFPRTSNFIASVLIQTRWFEPNHTEERQSYFPASVLI